MAGRDCAAALIVSSQSLRRSLLKARFELEGH